MKHFYKTYDLFYLIYDNIFTELKQINLRKPFYFLFLSDRAIKEVKQILQWQWYTVELQWLEHFWNHENTFETRVVQGNVCYLCTRSCGIIGISFLVFLT